MYSYSVKKLVLLAILSGLLFVGKLTLIFLPNIEFVTFLLVIFTLIFTFKEALMLSIIYTAVEMAIWGLTEQAYIWIFIVVVTYVFKPIIKSNFMFWSLYSGFLGLAFGILCSIPILILTNKTIWMGYIISNIPFDVVHMVGNYFIMLLFGELVYRKLQTLVRDYNRR